MSYQEAELRSGKSGQFWVREEIGVAGEKPPLEPQERTNQSQQKAYYTWCIYHQRAGNSWWRHFRCLEDFQFVIMKGEY